MRSFPIALSGRPEPSRRPTPGGPWSAARFWAIRGDCCRGVVAISTGASTSRLVASSGCS